MKYSIRWKDCDKSSAVIAHLEDKISKFEDFKFINENAKVEIVKYPKNGSFTVRINLDLKGCPMIRSEAKADDILTAINSCVEKTLDQLRRVKTQIYTK